MTSVVEINSEGVRVSVEKGFLLIIQGECTDKVPLTDIEALIINSHGAYISNHAIKRLSEYNVPIVHCGANSVPCSLTIAYGNNVYRKERVEMQISASLPLKKNLWQQVTKAKILNQAAVLQIAGKKYNDLVVLASKVLSGDSGNAEALAAQFYWKRLYGGAFRRDQDAPGINGFLNYGYAILRAAMCRNIVAAGLLPELGIHHHNQMNPYCLADDLMEPFRPYTDLCIYTMDISTDAALSPAHKKKLISILNLGINQRGISSHLRNSMQRCVECFVKSLQQKKAALDYPIIDATTLQDLGELFTT